MVPTLQYSRIPPFHHSIIPMSPPARRIKVNQANLAKIKGKRLIPSQNSEIACAAKWLFLQHRPMSATTKGSKASSATAFDLERFLATRTEAVNRALDRFLPPATTRPATIHEAMRYSLFAGGKRMRPALCLAATTACAGKETEAMPLACAVECIHTSSLVHDDLPPMEADDYG